MNTDHIEHLQHLLSIAKEALKPFAHAVDFYNPQASDDYPCDRGEFNLGQLRNAQEILTMIMEDENDR
jgi:hypothetical protein